MQSYARYSQVGHILHNLANGNTLDWSKSIEAEILTVEGHKTVCQILYDEHYDKIILKDSYLCNASERFRSTSFSQLITENLLPKADEVSFEVHIKDLSSLVWLCLQYYTTDMHMQPYYPFFHIENLRFGVSNIKTSVMSSLCQTDMLVFLMATIQCTASRIKLTDYPNEETRIMQSFLFPVCLKQQLCTDDQAKWWSAAYQFFTKSFNPKEMRFRHRLIQGMETVRLVGTHGMSLQLLVHIAKSLDEKLKVLRQAKTSADSSSSEIIALENRAAVFWNHAKSSIEEIQKKNNYQLQSARIFQEPRDNVISQESISHIRSEVIFATSLIAMRKSEYSKAVDGFRQLSTPEAKLFQAKALRKWSKKNIADKNHNEGNNLLQEARETLYELLESITTNPEAKEFTEPANKELDKIDQLMHHLFKDPSETHPFRIYSNLSSVGPESSKLETGGFRINTQPFASTSLKSNQPTHESSKMDQETQCYTIIQQHPPHSLPSQINMLNQNCQKLRKEFEKNVDENKKNEEFLVEFITGQCDTVGLFEDTRQKVEQFRQNNEELKVLVEQSKNTTCALMDSMKEETTVLKELKSQVKDMIFKVSSPPPPTDDTAPKFKEEETSKGPEPGQNREKSQHRNNTQTSTTNSDHQNETKPHRPFPDLSSVETATKSVETDSLRRNPKPSFTTTSSQMGDVKVEAAPPPVVVDAKVPKLENTAPNQNNAESRPIYLTQIFTKSSTLNYLLYFGVTILILFLYPCFLYYFTE
ncbi:E3 SUMO-protein ligase RanBP2-like [Physella acuta]|uniref:E3 SUMO-protein ligase RanBP2-like n=1 Tax=Physella acuta TaxID=109671 RepID=UPI0027DCBFFA|nr:E3 SUMO-protein ligase RanBP2-like [Physella acuta]